MQTQPRSQPYIEALLPRSAGVSRTSRLTSCRTPLGQQTSCGRWQNSRPCFRHDARDSRPWFLRWLPHDKGPAVDLVLADDHDFVLAMAIAPFTIGGTGISDRQTIIWDGNDTGTSGAFQLTDDEVVEVEQSLEAAGADSTALVPLREARGLRQLATEQAIAAIRAGH